MSPRHITLATRLLAVLVALTVTGSLLSIYLKLPGYSHILLQTGSTGFLAIAIIRSGLRSPYGRLITAGLFFCWLGDLLGPISFDVGVAAFLVAHVGFVMAFRRLGLVRSRILPSLAVATVLSTLILVWLLPYVISSNRGLIIGYTAAITVMLGLSFATPSGPSRRWILYASPVFYVSDLIVARWAFVGGGSTNAYFCYPLYSAACVLFAFSVQPIVAPSSEPPPIPDEVT